MHPVVNYTRRMQRPSLDTLPPLSDPTGNVALPSCVSKPPPRKLPLACGVFLFAA